MDQKRGDRERTVAKSGHSEVMPTLHEKDYYYSAKSTAAVLRARRTDEVDLDAIAEELEDLARSEKRGLRSAIVQLYMHLLKIRYRPDNQTANWNASVKNTRMKLPK